jgi:hypothetical protein
MDIMRGMKRRASAGELPRFQFVEINGLRLPTPKHAYTALYEVSVWFVIMHIWTRSHCLQPGNTV